MFSFLFQITTAYSKSIFPPFSPQDRASEMLSANFKRVESTLTNDISGTGMCNIPTNFFSSTYSWKFTELSYNAIKCLLCPEERCNDRFTFKKPTKPVDLETKIYRLLSNVVTTVPPTIFDIYNKSFNNDRFYECFLILERLFNCNSEVERIIIECILCRNSSRKSTPSAICYVDPITKQSSLVQICKCSSQPQTILYLPRCVLDFEEFLSTSMFLDEIIIGQLDRITGCEFAKDLNKLIKLYNLYFKSLDAEARVLFFLRVKFFAFNSIGYSISHMSSGPKNQVRKMLLETAYSTSTVFYKTFAIGLGLLK